MGKFKFTELTQLNKETHQTKTYYTPQIFIDGEWCYIKDETTAQGIERYETMEEAHAAVTRLETEEQERHDRAEYERLKAKYEVATK